ncbi:MAG: DEAD/DEAH box helicase, partial [Chitinispirillales bacterium]|nr:DEAD/DEAH box helicase [Chitinispirillales bacterium]
MAAPVPSQLDFLSNLRKIPKLGPKRVAALESAGIKTIGELLSYYPVKYIDRSKRVEIKDAGLFGDCAVTVLGVVEKARAEYFGKAKIRAAVRDGSGGELEAIWYIRNMKIEAGETLVLTGKVIDNRGKLLMIHPVFEKITEKSEVRPILAVYSVKEPMREAGINQKLLRGSIEWALKNVGNYKRVLPDSIEKKQNFPPLAECLREVHIPSDLSTLDKYKARLKYEELYRLALNLRWNKKKFALPGYPMAAGDLDAKLRSALPFALTESQEAAIKILYADAARPERMHRLLQGDVGSGKTVTALFAALPALNSGRQAAWMAPTEVLAKQTKATVEKYLGTLGIRVEYIGAGDTPEKRAALRDLALGELQFAIGTHALFMPSVKFRNLGMVIIDEQHKFGAAQRLKLQEKGPASDFLLMSATPIPQTLAKTLYGDLGIVEIASRPIRAPVSTHIVPHGKRAGMEKFILEQITAGARAFYVVPRIDEQGGDLGGGDDDGSDRPTHKPAGKPSTAKPSADDIDYSSSIKTVESVAERLKKGPLALVPIHTLHGRMPPGERDAAIEAFKGGAPGVLVSTSIVEVGVDVGDAAVMAVENPECFGLAQLHQIRGRVGRGGRPSYCFLLPGANASQNEKTAERLKFLCGCADGFEIAEQDLRSRGPGEAAGYRQSGWDNLAAADILSDAGTFRAILSEIDLLFAKEP